MEINDPIQYEPDYDREFLTSRKWKDCVFPSIELFRNGQSFKYLVFPSEGRFIKGNVWQFKKEFEKYEPLLCDLNTARLMVQFYDITQNSRDNIEQAMMKRSVFISIANILWKHASF